MGNNTIHGSPCTITQRRPKRREVCLSVGKGDELINNTWWVDAPRVRQGVDRWFRV